MLARHRIVLALRANRLSPCTVHAIPLDSVAKAREAIARLARTAHGPRTRLPIHELQQALDAEPGELTPLLALARRLHLDLDLLLTPEECILRVLRSTLQHALDNDLKGSRPLTPAEEQIWLERIVRAADPGELAAAQQALLDHPHNHLIQHIGRVWPRAAGLRPLRLAYLELLHERRPTLPRHRSVVGAAELLLHGGPEERASVYHLKRWQDYARLNPDYQLIPLRCSLSISAQDLNLARPCFSMQEHLGAYRTDLAETSEPLAEPTVPNLEEPELRWRSCVDPSAALPWVEALGQALTRALLGPGAPTLTAAPLQPGASALPAVLEGDLQPLAGELALLAQPGVVNPSTLRAVLGLALAAQDGSPLLAARAQALNELGEEAPASARITACSQLIHALALARLVAWIRHILAHTPPDRTPPPIHGRLRRLVWAWLNDPSAPALTNTRRARQQPASDVPGAPPVHLEPLAEEADARLARHLLQTSHQPLAAIAWILNEWEDGWRSLRALAAGAGLPTEGRHSAVGLLQQLLSDDPRAGGAFHKTACMEGRAAQNLLALAQEGRRLGLSPAAWRRWLLARLHALPASGWPASSQVSQVLGPTPLGPTDDDPPGPGHPRPPQGGSQRATDCGSRERTPSLPLAA